MDRSGLIGLSVAHAVRMAAALAIGAAACLAAAALVAWPWPEPAAPRHASGAPPSQDLRQPSLPASTRDVLPDYVEYPGLLPDYALDEIYVMCRSLAVHVREAEGALLEGGGDVDAAIELADAWLAPPPASRSDSDCYWQCILQGWNRTSCDPVYEPVVLPCSLEDRGQCGWTSCTPVRDGNATYCGYTEPALEGSVVRWIPLDMGAAGGRG